MIKNVRKNFMLSEEEDIDLKCVSFVQGVSNSDFIRSAIAEKIKRDWCKRCETLKKL